MVSEPTVVTDSESPVSLNPQEQLESLTGRLSPGERRSGWLLARFGKSVTRDMILEEASRFHFTTGEGNRFWSGPSYGPPEARVFLGPSVEPELRPTRVRFEEDEESD